MTFKEILEFNFIQIGSFQVNLFQVFVVIAIVVIARLIVRLVTRLTRRFFTARNIDTGRQFAFSQFVKYVIYTGATLMAFESIGISLSVLWGGAAALMVGIGLGLQQTFNDIVSGIILLVEGTVEVGDIVEVDSTVGRVSSIGIRTSKVESRDGISLLIPNSKLVGENATNWSTERKNVRFHINVGVAYSSDIQLVTSLLLQAAKANPKVLQQPAPEVQFRDFGNSSLDFILMIYSREYFGIEYVKSEIRYRIVELFRQHNIEIPFPQRDLWIRNSSEVKMSGQLEVANLSASLPSKNGLK